MTRVSTPKRGCQLILLNVSRRLHENAERRVPNATATLWTRQWTHYYSPQHSGTVIFYIFPLFCSQGEGQTFPREETPPIDQEDTPQSGRHLSSKPGRHPWQQTPPSGADPLPPKRPVQRTVGILLECERRYSPELLLTVLTSRCDFAKGSPSGPLVCTTQGCLKIGTLYT